MPQNPIGGYCSLLVVVADSRYYYYDTIKGVNGVHTRQMLGYLGIKEFKEKAIKQQGMYGCL